jgi:hypothetical protein
MKQIYALFIATLATLFNSLNGQVVLNEMYGSPGTSKHEFFELFNTSTESTPASVDGFTIVTYFEEGANKGFYVLDLPALTISPRSYFVGSSALPFNYQGVSGSTSSNFSWNDPSLTTNGGFLQKWVMTGNDNSDGNKDYNSAAVPSNFNDLFYRRSAGGFNYAMFIFQNGLLVNNFYGGTSSNTQPSQITTMASINLSYNVGGVMNSFVFQPSQLTNSGAEYVNSDAGSDNGYIRDNDGVCGTWVKSSSSANHTPGVTNGSSVGSGSLTITASIVRGVAPATTSLLTYDITAGTASSFPVVLQVYVDNGSVAGQLDATDTYLTSTTQNAVAEAPSTLYFSPLTANVLVVAKTAAGCFGQVKAVVNPQNQTLPVKLLSFNGHFDKNQVQLSWKVEENETAKLFELQRSFDGITFNDISAVAASQNTGTETYRYADGTDLKQTSYYRLRMTDVNLLVEYSKIIAIRPGVNSDLSVRFLQNPVVDKLYFSIEADGTAVYTIKVMDLSGTARVSKAVQLNKGSNLVSIELPAALPRGLYIAAFLDQRNKLQVNKFLKN